jgi:hypothetical protein
MVIPFLKYTLLLALCLVWSKGMTQGGVFSQVTLNKNNVYVGEAVELSVAVYTQTWFTRGVDIGNIKVNGAFSVYFRAVSTSKKINGKTYAGVQLLYNIFPFQEEDIIIPALDIEVETPVLGGFKGIKRTIKTKERILKVRQRPPSANKDQWLVTTGMSIKENWNGNINQVKVGEVLERKISRNAYGTVAELIPPIAWDSLSGVSVYPSRSTVNTNRSKTAISASRTDGVQYLFQKEGLVSIPEMEFVWWHPYQKKFLKRTLKGRTIDVLPNPDLELLNSVRDSLNLRLQNNISEETSEIPTLIFGLTPRQFVLLVLVIGLLGFLLLKTVFWSRRHIKAKISQYKTSEAYAFQKFLGTVRGKQSNQIMPNLYSWISRIQAREPTLNAFAECADYTPLYPEIERLELQLNNKSKHLKLDKKVWRAARKSFFKDKKKAIESRFQVNP